MKIETIGGREYRVEPHIMIGGKKVDVKVSDVLVPESFRGIARGLLRTDMNLLRQIVMNFMPLYRFEVTNWESTDRMDLKDFIRYHIRQIPVHQERAAKLMGVAKSDDSKHLVVTCDYTNKTHALVGIYTSMVKLPDGRNLVSAGLCNDMKILELGGECSIKFNLECRLRSMCGDESAIVSGGTTVAPMFVVADLGSEKRVASYMEWIKLGEGEGEGIGDDKGDKGNKGDKGDRGSNDGKESKTPRKEQKQKLGLNYLHGRENYGKLSEHELIIETNGTMSVREMIIKSVEVCKEMVQKLQLSLMIGTDGEKKKTGDDKEKDTAITDREISFAGYPESLRDCIGRRIQSVHRNIQLNDRGAARILIILGVTVDMANRLVLDAIAQLIDTLQPTFV